MKSKNTMRAFAAASCCAAVVLADDYCPANSNMCSCFDPEPEKNREDWRLVITYNTCCATCVLNAAVENGCLDNNSCGYDEAKAVFEACGSEDWDDDEPAGFLPPQSCEFFDATADDIVNWRTAAPAYCLKCVTGKLLAETPSTSAFTLEQTVNAFEGCGLTPFPTLDPAQERALVLPQSGTACFTGDDPATDQLTPTQLVNWRRQSDGDIPAVCVTCFTNRLQAGEYAYDEEATFGGVAGAVADCGYQFVAELAAALTPEEARDAGFIPPGCGGFVIGDEESGYQPGIANGLPREADCTQCINAVANGTINGKSYPGLADCTPTDANCNYEQTADAFNYCGAGGYWAEEVEGGDKWPTPDSPIESPFTIP